MSGNRGLTIGQVARRAGLRASAIRYYEAAGILPEPVRIGGWRRYDPSVLTRLAAIGASQRAGFSLDEIRTLLRGFPRGTPPSVRWNTLARKKLPEVEAMIARAEEMKRLLLEGMECGCRGVDECATLAAHIERSRGIAPPKLRARSFR
jgi:MerR family transcriptional regulator, redox-sensitive transcriptional activator SoxR